MKKGLKIGLGVLAGLIVIGGVFGSEDSPTTNVPKTEVTTEAPEKPIEKPKETEKIYGVGEEITITKPGEKEPSYSIIINSAKLTSSRNQFADEDISGGVVDIEYTYKNLNSSEDIYISSSNFNIIDDEGNVLESYPATGGKSQKKTPTGAKCTANMFFALPSETKGLKIIYKNNMFDSKATCTINATIQE